MEAGKRALDFSIRAVDAYRKTLLIDKVTSADDQSPPVYLLNELSDILRSCSVDLTQEIVEYAFRRLRHHSPQVKYKVLRFFIYTVNRAGSAAYRKELQSYSSSIRELFNFQGQVDPCKGNAPNQAVRDAAHEAIIAIFSSDVGGLRTSKSLNNRIEGFGNGNFSKSFISSYGSSVSDEIERGSLRRNVGSGCFDSVTYKQDYESNLKETVDHTSKRESKKVSNPEEELLDKMTASRGLSLQLTHERLECFLSSAKTLDTVKMVVALKAKLRSPSWQVQFKSLCVLQALLQEKVGSLLQAIEADQGDLLDCIQACLCSPQATLKKKAKEVFESFQALKTPSEWNERDTSFLNPPPATSCQVVNLMSFSNDDFTPFQAVETSPNSVMVDPFDGMCIHGSSGSTELHVEDLLSSCWTERIGNRGLLSGGSTNKSEHYEELAVGNVQKEGAAVLIAAPQSNAASNIFTSSGIGARPGVDSKTFRTNSNGNVLNLQNLNALYMFPVGEPKRNNGALQQCPGGAQGFESGIHNATTIVNGQTTAGRHAFGDNYFKEFGFSN